MKARIIKTEVDKVSEVSNHKRPLSLAMIRALSQGLGIPTEVLVQQSALSQCPAQRSAQASVSADCPRRL